MIHPNCDHMCTSDCRREGCNCLCGEFHDSMTAEEIQEVLADELWHTRISTVSMLLTEYTDPKPKYDGMLSRQIASKIVDALFPKIDPVAVNELSERN